MSKFKKKTACIIGLGKIGLTYDYLNKSKTKSHYNAIKKSKYFELVASVDNGDMQNLKKIDIPIFKNIKNLSKSYNPYFLIVSVPTNMHMSIFQDIMKYLQPKIILFEKPLAKNFVEAKKIVKLCEKNKIHLYVNYIRNYLPNLEKLKKIVFGKKLHVNLSYSGNILNDFCHYFYLFNYLFGVNLYLKEKKIDNMFDNCKITLHNSVKKNKKDSLKIKGKNLFIHWKNSNTIRINNGSKTTILNVDLDNYQNHVIDNIVKKVFFKKDTRIISGNDALKFHKIFNDKKN